MSKNYHLLWSSFLISNIGDWLQKIALPILILQKTGSAYHMASIYGVSFIPWIVFSIFGGVLADKLKRTRIIAIGHFFSLFFLFFLILELGQPNINLLLVYIATFCLSSVEPLVHPSFQSLLPQLVDKNKLSQANAALQGIDNTLGLIGPMVSGSLILFVTPIVSLWLNAFSFMLAGFIILIVKEPKLTKENSHNETIYSNIIAGLKYTKKNKVVLSGSILFLFTNFGINIFQANLIYFITKFLGYTSLEYGIVLSVTGFGALIGAGVAPIVNKYFHTGFIISMSTIFAGIFTILLFQAENLWFIAIMLGLTAVFGNINVISYFTLRQRVVEPYILGRVISVTRMISYMSIPLGAFLGGFLIQQSVSIYTVILLAGIIRLFAGFFGYFSPLNKNKT
ncbi:TPA: MFS transporter [Enterococcus faecalis]|nr:MFS transporter [Listeria monocytogenes]